MGRKKKTEVAVGEVVAPMNDDVMNLPVEEKVEEKVEAPVEEKVEKKVEEQVQAPIEAPVEEVIAPVVSEPLKKRIKSNSTLVNVRDGIEGNVLFRIQNGTPVIVEEDLGDWVKISGYVLKALVSDR